MLQLTGTGLSTADKSGLAIPNTRALANAITMAGPTIGQQATIGAPDSARVTVSSPQGAYEVRANIVPAVFQTDKVDIAGIGAGASLVVDFGSIIEIGDYGSVPLAVAEVTMIDPNGVPHDLFALVQSPATDNFPKACPTLPAGRYTFINISGGALTTDGIYIKHIGARNLA